MFPPQVSEEEEVQMEDNEGEDGDIAQGWKFYLWVVYHCQELGQQAGWLLASATQKWTTNQMLGCSKLTQLLSTHTFPLQACANALDEQEEKIVVPDDEVVVDKGDDAEDEEMIAYDEHYQEDKTEENSTEEDTTTTKDPTEEVAANKKDPTEEVASKKINFII